MMVKLRYSTLDFQSSVEFNCPQKKKKKKKKKNNNNNNNIICVFIGQFKYATNVIEESNVLLL